jgi:hypothetical protein
MGPDDPGLDEEATGLLDVSEVRPLALVGVGFGTGFDDVALQLTTARPSKAAVTTRNESASLPAQIRAI